ncbi:MAG: radical SAM protein [Candidatus Muiribacteriota bacterium]
MQTPYHVFTTLIIPLKYCILTLMMPKYVELLKTKNHNKKNFLINYADSLWEKCRLCGFFCKVDRNKTEGTGCKAGNKIKVASFSVHKGEEPPISGTKGSGTVFFSNCSLECNFCQNYPISQLSVGKELSVDEFAEKLLFLQKKGVHNINLVTPSHFIPLIFKGILAAGEKGLIIPIVYNTSGYDSLESFYLLKEFVDIMLPDMKYYKNLPARKYSGINNYVEINRKFINAVINEYCENIFDESGIIKRGFILRHLVLPFEIKNTYEIINYIAKIKPDIFLSIMRQYFPAWRASEKQQEKLSEMCYNKIIEHADSMGLENVYIQEE